MNNATILKRVRELRLGNDGCQMDYSKYMQLIADLEAAVRVDNNKARGLGKLDKLAKAIFKSAPPHSELMQYSKVVGDVQYVLDGYRIAGFYEHLDLPDFDACKEKNNLPPTWFNVAQLIKGVEYESDIPLKLPTIAELKSEITIAKSKSKVRGAEFMWKFENGPAVNAKFLLDFMEAYPDMKIYKSVNKPMVSPLYIDAEKGMGILLPIACDTEKEPGIHSL